MVANEFGERIHIRHAAKSIAASEDDLPADPTIQKPSIPHQCLQSTLVSGGEFRHQCVARSRRDQMLQRLQTCGMKPADAALAVCRTDVECLIPETMTILQKHHLAAA